MKLVVMLNGHNHGIDGNSTGSTQSSTLFSGKERGIIYSVQLMDPILAKKLSYKI